MSLLSKAFGDIITFTRASAATRVNAQGLIESVAANVPRIDYDPVTLECKGLLIEEQRTNLATDSAITSGLGFFTNDAMLGVDYNASTTKTPDGSGRAAKVTIFGAGSGDKFVQKNMACSAAAGEKVTGSIWLWSDTLTELVLFIYSLEPFGSVQSIAVPVNAVPKRLSITTTLAAASTEVSFRIDAQNGAGQDHVSGSFYAWGSQVEVGGFATSYIPAAGAQVTRAADVATIDMLSPFFNPSEGTIYIELNKVYAFTGTSFPKVISFDAGLANNEICIFNQAGDNRFDCSLTKDSVNAQAVCGAGTLSKNKVAIGFSGTTISGSCNGVAPSQTVIAGVPVVTKANIGKGWWGGDFLGGHIRKIRYFPTRLSDAQLQALTA